MPCFAMSFPYRLSYGGADTLWCPLPAQAVARLADAVALPSESDIDSYFLQARTLRVALAQGGLISVQSCASTGGAYLSTQATI